jgi:two-component system cell cycle sensor histidine kinase/response regulator CckA
MDSRRDGTMAQILVVDDEEPIRKLLRSALESLGHAVEEASDGVEAVLIYGRRAVDLTITDIIMPDFGGLKLIQAIRDRDPSAKIIAISGGAGGGKYSFLSTARTFPGVKVLQKPFQMAELAAAVTDLLAIPAAGGPSTVPARSHGDA